jgi:prefoldin subunit 5
MEQHAYWFDDDMTPVCESRFVRQLERELNAANAQVDRLTAKVAQLYEGAEEAKQRIKRLEDIISRASSRFFRDGSNGMVAIGMLNILEEVRKP